MTRTIITNYIIKKISKEYENFKKNMCSKTPKEIFESAYRISGYTNLFDYFDNGGFTDFINNYIDYKENESFVIEKLKIFSQKQMLFELYESHFHYETLYLNLCDDIDALIKYVVFDDRD